MNDRGITEAGKPVEKSGVLYITRGLQIASFTFQTLQWRGLDEHGWAPALILSKGEARAVSVGGVCVQMEQVLPCMTPMGADRFQDSALFGF